MSLITALTLGALVSQTPGSTELTIYNQGFALVKDVRTLDLKTGVQHVRIEDIAQMIEANSVGIRSVSKPGSFTVLEQNYQYDLISPIAILNKAVGKRITFNQFMADGRINVLEGTLLSSPTSIVGDANGGNSATWNGMVIQTDDGRIILNPSGQIEVTSIPEGLISKPSLLWMLDSNREGANNVELSYLTQGISWNSDYVLSLDQEGKVGGLKGWVTLTNNSGATFKDAKLKLLAGEVFREQGGGMGGRGRPEMAMMKAAAEDSFSEEQFSEYHLYTLQRPATVANREMKQVSLLEAVGVPVTKKLVIDAMRMYGYYIPNEGQVGVGDLKPLVFIEFKNDQASHLGMPLPMGTVKVFQRDSTGSLQMLGEASIGHTPKNEKISLSVGRSFDIVSSRKRTEFRWLGNSRNGCVETFEIEVRNRKETAETVHLFERFGGQWKIMSNSDPFTKLESHLVDFVLELKPNQVKKVTYTVETRW